MSNRFASFNMDDDQLRDVALVRSFAEAIEEIMDNYPGREGAVAITNLETTVMWANKAISRSSING